MHTARVRHKSFQYILALTIFVGAFLLFFVQPFVARELLPVFGGAASVWLACLLFFQTFLLFGYCYAHVLRLCCSPLWQCVSHLTLLSASLLWMLLGPEGLVFENLESGNPVLSVLVILTIKIGAPFLLLAGTSPLIQHWFSLDNDQPYRLYALSNVGSLLALLSYPFVESVMTLTDQFVCWVSGLVAYLVFMVAILYRLSSMTGARTKQTTVEIFQAAYRHRFIWTALSACGAMMLLSTSNALIREVAPVPMLWVLPLAVYLCTFILTFDKAEWYSRSACFSLLFLSMVALLVMFEAEDDWSLSVQISIYCLVLFFSCLVCHGEMVRLRPEKEQLTEFYLFLSLGGVLGALFVNFLAPIFLDVYFEFEIATVLTVLLASQVALSSIIANLSNKRVMQWRILSLTPTLALMLFFLIPGESNQLVRELVTSRNFFGASRVTEFSPGSLGGFRSLSSDGINHGSQLTHEKYRQVPTTYFSYRSGVGIALLNHRKPGREVGIIGLGTGTLAAYGNPGDHFRFYEINPTVIDIAQQYFTFLEQSEAEVSVVKGDARLMLKKDLENGQKFDILVIDAFSGDAIPTHLLTEEAWNLYWRLLKDDGILAVHLSNKYLDLVPVIRYHNEQQDDLILVQVDSEEEPSWDINSASWLIQTGNRSFLQKTQSKLGWPGTEKPPLRWSDEISSVVGLFY